jgi:hypothetical protein
VLEIQMRFDSAGPLAPYGDIGGDAANSTIDGWFYPSD